MTSVINSLETVQNGYAAGKDWHQKQKTSLVIGREAVALRLAGEDNP